MEALPPTTSARRPLRSARCSVTSTRQKSTSRFCMMIWGGPSDGWARRSKGVVSVFPLPFPAILNPPISTHGRGFWFFPALPPRSPQAFRFRRGLVDSPDLRGGRSTYPPAVFLHWEPPSALRYGCDLAVSFFFPWTGYGRRTWLRGSSDLGLGAS